MKKPHMFKPFVAAIVAALAFASPVRSWGSTVEEYALTMRLHIPRIYDNAESLGSRKYQTQTLKGTLLVVHPEDGGEPSLEIRSLENHTYKIGGARVSYETYADNVLWHLIGSNAKDKFKTASVSFAIDADPSYNIGEDEPDNTLILTLSGKGTHNSMRGYASGQIGCGCRAYGHKSPTRIMGEGGSAGEVTDIAAVWGSWSAKYRRTCRRSADEEALMEIFR